MDGFCDTRSFFGCRNFDESALIARQTVRDKARESDSAGFVLSAAKDKILDSEIQTQTV